MGLLVVVVDYAYREAAERSVNLLLKQLIKHVTRCAVCDEIVLVESEQMTDLLGGCLTEAEETQLLAVQVVDEHQRLPTSTRGGPQRW